MDIRIHNLEVYVDGKRVDNPAQRLAIALPALLLGFLLAGFVIFLLLPILGFGLLLVAGIMLLVAFWLVAWFLSPVILPLLAAIGLFKWISRD